MIFISYRREDTKGVVTALYQELVARFGSDRVFVDFNDIPVGGRWTDELRQQLQNSSVLVAVIGAKWGEARYDKSWPERKKRDRLRLEDPEDWVRAEICTGIQRFHAGRMKVVVVMADQVALPDKEWECELDQLPEFQQAQLRSGKDFVHDADRLCAELRLLLPPPSAAPTTADRASDAAVLGYLANEARAHARIQLPLVSESGHPVVAGIGHLRIDLPMVVSHQSTAHDPAVRLCWIGQDVLAIHDEFRLSHTLALLVDRSSRHEDIRRECSVAERLAAGGRMVVVGDPGCGKTTLLQWECHHYAARASAPSRPSCPPTTGCRCSSCAATSPAGRCRRRWATCSAFT